jgi:hypothetical protein
MEDSHRIGRAIQPKRQFRSNCAFVVLAGRARQSGGKEFFTDGMDFTTIGDIWRTYTESGRRCV